MKNRILRLLNIIIGAAAVLGFSAYVLHMADSVDMRQLAHPAGLLGVAVMAIASALIIPISAFAWMYLLRSCGVNQRWTILARIMGITQLAKYLPGNIAQHLGRLGMSLRSGIPAFPFTTTVLAEGILAILAAVVFGAFACGLGGLGSVALPLDSRISTSATLPVLSLLAICALTALLLCARLIRRLARRKLHSDSVPVPGTRALSLAFACYITNYIAMSAGVAALSGLLIPDPPSAWLLTGAFALSWILGFLLPGAPAGLGVREAAMLAILQAAGHGAELLPFIIGLRVATTLGDIMCFAVSAFAARVFPVPLPPH